ncbi:MAG TPA: hypothetical protein VH186_08385 [Chloroflexia bacterium]|nr:hypothetical protein [Chloroflexia bacterium]
MLTSNTTIAGDNSQQETLNLEASPYFQRSISLEYDLGDPQFIDFFAPTDATADAILKVLSGIEYNPRQRSHVILGAYGTGKSLVGLVLGALFNPAPALTASLLRLRDRLLKINRSDLADLISQRLTSSPATPASRILPVTLSGDEGELATALIRACRKALEREELSHLSLPGFYNAAITTLERWRQNWPDVFSRWESLVRERLDKTPDQLVEALHLGKAEAYQDFCRLYPELTAGASFDPFAEGFNGRAVDLLAEIALTVKEAGFTGLAIIWDEFGRFLEERASEPFGRDAQLIQELAERCARSGEQQLHLVLITHKSLRQYGRGLAGGVDKEWSKIEGRFSSIEIASDPRTVYGLIERGITFTDSDALQTHLKQHSSQFDSLLEASTGSRFFSGFDSSELRYLVVEGAYPLHPLATYCLPRISDRVAQNQRTLFTFLAAEDENGLIDLFRHTRLDLSSPGFPLVCPGHLFDYFSAGIRASTEQDGVHWIWSAVERARQKLESDPLNQDGKYLFIMKTLAVLHVAQAYENGAPSTEIVAFALNQTNPSNEAILQISHDLEYLASQHLIRLSKINGGWEFVRRLTDFNIEAEVATVLQERPPSLDILKSLLSAILPPPMFQSRRYNEEYGMVRYFDAEYRTVPELESDAANPPDWNNLLKSLDYSDGLVIYGLAFTVEELARARVAAAIVSSLHPRVLVILPAAPLPARGPLEDLYGLKQARTTPKPKELGEEANKELDFFEQDTRVRIERSMAALLNPRQNALWYIQGAEHREINSPGAVSSLLSDISGREFNCTPRVYNENFNKRRPAGVQVTASQKVIKAILDNEPGPTLGLTGYGPDMAILNATLKANGILSEEGHLSPPAKSEYPEMAQVWEECLNFYRSSEKVEEGLSFEIIVDRLQRPPYGIRKGVLPLLLAVTFRDFLSTSNISKNGSTIEVTATTFTDIVNHPASYTIKYIQIDHSTLELLQVLEAHVKTFIRPEELHAPLLNYLAKGLLRWLQSLPRYSRDTTSVSSQAVAFRRLIRNAPTDPVRSLLVQLPRIASKPGDILALFDELNRAFEHLEEKIAQKIAQTFDGSDTALSEAQLGLLINSWYQNVLKDSSILPLFSDPVSEELANIGSNPDKYRIGLVDSLSKRLVGSLPRDWSDDLARRFDEKIVESRARLEREIGFLQSSSSPEDPAITQEVGKVTEISLAMPDQPEPVVYRFNQVKTLSEHGKRLAESLQRTIDISGRSLDLAEKRAIALELLRYIIEGKSQ